MKLTFSILSVTLLLGFRCPAQVPEVISYQGRVQAFGTNFSGTGQFKFALVSPGTNISRQATAMAIVTSGFITSISVLDGGAGYIVAPAVTISDSTGTGATAVAQVSGGAVTNILVQSAGSGYSSSPTVTVGAPPASYSYGTFWSNDGTSTAGSEPVSAVTVPVQAGLMNVFLGDTNLANMQPVLPLVFNQADVRLRIWFSDGVNGFAQLVPDQRLGSVGYANMAAMAATAAQAGMAAQVVAGGIGSSALADQSVTTAKLASNAVTSAQIQAGSIQVANLSGSLLNNTFWKLGGNSGTTSSNYLGTSDNRPLELRVNGGSVLRLQASPSSSGYSGGFNIINGSPANYISPTAFGATIAGGGAVMYNSSSSASNLVANDFGTVGGGQGNVTYGFAGTIAGGYGNNCGSYSCVGGGYGNQANGLWSTIPGGYACQANGYASFAAGYEAIANHEGTFVWADDNAGAFTSTAPYQFLIRASGGVGINTPSPSARLHVSGLSANDQVIVRLEGSHPQGAWLDLAGTGSGGRVWDLISTASGNSEGAGKLLFRQASVGVVMTLSPNGFVGIGNVSPTNRLMVQNARCDGSTWINASDRNLKENFHQIDADRVLEKVCALPISQWNYKGDSGAAHMGPVAQDFHAEFGLGSDDKSIATVDESGVALAAIQGLNRKLETQLREEDAQILLLERKVEKLQQMEITVRKLQALLPAQ